MPTQTQRAASHLKAKDPVMAEVVDAVGILRDYYVEPDHFRSLCRIVVGQQLSYRAAACIWERARELVRRWSPTPVARLSEEDLRGAGLSRNKARFLRELAARFVARELTPRRLDEADDEALAELLGSIRGFGPWSSEMFMMFALRRPDIFSVGDAGLRRAICRLYPVTVKTYARRVPRIAATWSPYRSYACRYLWSWLDQA